MSADASFLAAVAQAGFEQFGRISLDDLTRMSRSLNIYSISAKDFWQNLQPSQF